VYAKCVWLNPEPEEIWSYRQSIAVIKELMNGRMYPTTLAGLEAADAVLREVVESPKTYCAPVRPADLGLEREVSRACSATPTRSPIMPSGAGKSSATSCRRCIGAATTIVVCRSSR